MATKSQCEEWIGDKKQEYCKTAKVQATQTYGRRLTATEIQYGWSCWRVISLWSLNASQNSPEQCPSAKSPS